MNVMSKNKNVSAVCFLAVLIFITGLLHTGFVRNSFGVNMRAGQGDMSISSASGHLLESDVSERRFRTGALSEGKVITEKNQNIKGYYPLDSIFAVLFKIAVIPCVVFIVFHFGRHENTVLQRLVFWRLHGQDGKRKESLLVS